MAIYTEGGIGRKKCKCGAFISAVYKSCPVCNLVFEKKSKEAKVIANGIQILPEQNSEPVKTHTEVLTPAGPCPCKLVPTQDQILAWKKEIQAEYDKRGEIIGNEGLRYFAQRFVGYRTIGYNYLVSVLEANT